jgi:hypothetical protein
MSQVLMFGGAFGFGVWFVRVHDDIVNARLDRQKESDA